MELHQWNETRALQPTLAAGGGQVSPRGEAWEEVRHSKELIGSSCS